MPPFDFSLPVSTQLKIIREILKRYRRGVISLVDDEAVFRLLITHHPDWPIKFEPGVQRFFIAKHPTWPDPRATFARLINGEIINFSWKDCIQPRKQRGFTLAAFRNAIRAQQISCRKAAGVKVGDSVDAHHEGIAFNELVHLFLDERGVKFEDVKTFENERDECKFVDLEIRAAWQEYHRKNAKLVVMSRFSHQRLRRKS